MSSASIQRSPRFEEPRAGNQRCYRKEDVHERKRDDPHDAELQTNLVKVDEVRPDQILASYAPTT
jgi:hypothetical protein